MEQDSTVLILGAEPLIVTCKKGILTWAIMDLGYRVEMGEAKGRKRKQVRAKTAGIVY